MEKQQDDAYKEAIEEYRAASRARIAKNSEINSNNIFGVLPRRQISNYFVQFRKVLQFLFITFSIYSIYTLQTIHMLCLSPNFFPVVCFSFSFSFCLLLRAYSRLQIILYWLGVFIEMRMLFVLLKSYIQWVCLVLIVPWTG